MLKKILPPLFIKCYFGLLNLLKIFQDYAYDLKRFMQYSATLSIKGQNRIEGRIIAHYHVLEKGLSFKEMRLGFGRDILIGLLNLLIEYSERGFDTKNKQYIAAISVIEKYIKVHEKNKYNVNDIKEIFKNVKKSSKSDLGGTVKIYKDEMIEESRKNFKKFAYSRHSVRDFTEENIKISQIEEIVKIAQRSPSVCNRQTSRVYVVSKKNDIEKHLSFQNGNRGFGHKINKLLIVTSDLRYFGGSYERNQSFVDAGIFSMSLLNAIHYNGLGAVALNWCVNKKRDKEYRRFAKIQDSENIILMIGIGNLPQNFVVPKSNRTEIGKVIRYL